ncbi:MAG: LysR family transcriptional regulator [Pigmentiphaga sp.]
MNMTIRHLRAFLAVALSRSFTRAAEEMQVSQPGLSLMMQEIESRLECQLFERTTRSVDLTDAGRRFLVSVRRILEELDEVVPELSGISVEQRKTLHVAATPVFSASIMPHVYMRLRERNPSIDLHLVDVPKQRMEELVRSDAVDCGLGTFAKRQAEFVRESLFTFDFVYAESKDKPFLFKDGQAPERLAWTDLPDEAFVELVPTSELQQTIERCKKKAGKNRRPGFVFCNLESLLGMAAAGVGPSIVPSFAISSSARSGLSTTLLEKPDMALNFSMISKKGRAQPAVMETFRATLLEVIHERAKLL